MEKRASYQSFQTPYWGSVPRTYWLASILCLSGESSKKFRNHPPKLDETEFMAGWLKKNLAPICLYRLKCTKFGQLILRKIIKIVATRWNSDRNHRPNALREMFSSLQLGRYLTLWPDNNNDNNNRICIAPMMSWRYRGADVLNFVWTNHV